MDSSADWDYSDENGFPINTLSDAQQYAAADDTTNMGPRAWREDLSSSQSDHYLTATAFELFPGYTAVEHDDQALSLQQQAGSQLHSLEVIPDGSTTVSPQRFSEQPMPAWPTTTGPNEGPMTVYADAGNWFDTIPYHPSPVGGYGNDLILRTQGLTVRDASTPSSMLYHTSHHALLDGILDHDNIHVAHVATPSYHAEADDESDQSELCYAKLIYQCLQEAPGHSQSLKEIYRWVGRNSAKAKNAKPDDNGWKNSVRHNLSMNHAFEKATAPDGSKKSSLWRLSREALERNSVLSTTRYRIKKSGKTTRKLCTSSARQTSGAKGGRATRDAKRRRNGTQRARPATRADQIERYYRYQDQHEQQQQQHHHHQQPQHTGVTKFATPSSLPSTVSSPHPSFHSVGSPQFFPNLQNYHGLPHPPMPSSHPYQAPQAIQDHFDLRSFAAHDGRLFADADSVEPETPNLTSDDAGFTPEDGFLDLMTPPPLPVSFPQTVYGDVKGGLLYD